MRRRSVAKRLDGEVTVGDSNGDREALRRFVEGFAKLATGLLLDGVLDAEAAPQDTSDPATGVVTLPAKGSAA